MNNMQTDIISEWLSGEETRCPYCGKEECIHTEEDDGYGYDGHFAVWTWRCFNCGSEWCSEYNPTPVAVYPREDKAEVVCV